MNCIKVESDWKAQEWDQANNVMNEIPLSSSDIQKLEDEYQSVTNGIEGFCHSCEVLSFTLHSANLEGQSVSYNSGLFNYREANGQHRQHPFKQ